MLSIQDSAAPSCAAQASLTRHVVVADPDGLHLRNCLAVVKAVQQYQAQVTIRGNGQLVDAASILGLMSLAALPGTELTLSASGPTAVEALEAISQLIEAEASPAGNVNGSLGPTEKPGGSDANWLACSVFA
jgi:phosphocarrier protein HPr